MSDREYAITLVNTLTDEQTKALIEFLSAIVDEDVITRIECDMLAQNPNTKKYDNFDEFMAEMEKDTNDEI